MVALALQDLPDVFDTAIDSSLFHYSGPQKLDHLLSYRLDQKKGYGIVMKRRGCGWNESFLLEVLMEQRLSCRWPWIARS